ncbi:MAG: hypothetical protein Q8O24_06875 [Gallionellaceae bacterium]|nr:hypothetical protein [Gallionellaceae bacterium]
MKTILILTTAVLVLALSACEQKKDLPTQAGEAAKELTEKVQESAQQATKELATKAQDAASKTGAEALKASKEVAATVEAGAQKTKEGADQFLADTVEHGREVTKSQNSASRQRGQKAEDEMMMEVGGKGK